jgi:hypothetical protein
VSIQVAILKVLASHGSGRATLASLKRDINYGEIFERNVGKASPLKLDRGLNGTWSKGGLMYAIPFK